MDCTANCKMTPDPVTDSYAGTCRSLCKLKKSVLVAAINVCSRRWIRFWFMMLVLLPLFLPLRTWARSRAALQLEVLALRHQVQVLHRSRPRRVVVRKNTVRANPHDR